MKTVTKTQQNPTLLEESFKPTKSMLKWLGAAEKLGPLASIIDVAKEAGVDRWNWYEWLRDPKFVGWWEETFMTMLKLNKWKLDAIGIQKASSDFNYFKLMQERVGNIQPDNQAPTNQNNFFHITPEMKERILGRRMNNG